MPLAHGADAAGLLDDELDAAIERILDERDRRGEAGRVDPRAEKPVLRHEHPGAHEGARAERDGAMERAVRGHQRIVDEA